MRHILHLASGEWFDEQGRPWLEHVPKIKLLRQNDARKPYPLSWDEQDLLFKELPPYLLKMALFAVNTGTRDQEVCQLRWSWEVEHPGLDTTFFLIPESFVKNGEERLVVLNDEAVAVIEEMRGKHEEYVFTYQGNPLRQMNQRAWKNARVRAGLPHVRVHDLKHTFGMRLRAAGVPEATEKDLLGHKHRDITRHYSEAQLSNLIEASNSVCLNDSRKTHAPTVLKRELRVVSSR